MPSWKKVLISGSDAALNSLNITNGITGSLLGTSSNALTASYVNPLAQDVIITGSLTNGAVGNTASGDNSHAEGQVTVAFGIASHAEGNHTLALNDYSHAEGYYTTASGLYSHAEGLRTVSLGNLSHAEGERTVALGSPSHAEGYYTLASVQGAHSEGSYKQHQDSGHMQKVIIL